MKQNIKQEKGSMTVYAAVVLLSMLLILTAIFFTSNAVRKSEIRTVLKLKESYEADNERTTEIYESLVGNMYTTDGLILHYDAINNTGNGHSNTTTTWKDLSGSGNDGVLNGATWNDTYLAFDGVDDIVSTTNELNLSSSQAITIEFVFIYNNIGNNALFFELSEDSNRADCGFYINTQEFGTNDITFAMKYEQNAQYNQKMVDGLFYSSIASYTVQFNSEEQYDNYISMYRDAEERQVVQVSDDARFSANLSNRTLTNHKLYIGARYDESLCTEMELRAIRVYNRALTQSKIEQNYN